MMRRVLISQTYVWAFSLISAISMSAQNVRTGDIIQISFEQTQLVQALTDVSRASGVNVVFSPDMIPEKVVNREFNTHINVILATLLNDTELTFREQNGQIILYRDPVNFTSFSVNGYVEDVETGERLFAAHVYDLISGAGAITNEYGFFSLQSKGKHALLKVSYLGCQADTIYVDRTQARLGKTIQLESLVVLREVVIEDERNGELDVEPLSGHHYNDRQLATKSYLGGEFDVQRYVETLPGVSIGTDGIGGMHIRGGNGDQNLILYDGVPIYHATHAIGILSVFNPLMMREVSLLKGDYPARYAGRLSSVMDVRTKEGNNREWSFETSIGPATANALIEGPVIKDKVGVLVAARRFLPGVYLRNLSRREKEEDGLTGETRYAFTDINAKCNIVLTPRDRIYLSYYHGDDEYKDFTNTQTIEQQTLTVESFERSLDWGNSVGIVRWNHQFGPHVFANTTLTLSRFELQSLDYVDFTQTLPSQARVTGFTSREFKSRIKDAGARFDIDHFITNAHRLRYGVTFTNHEIAPKSIAFDDAAEIDGFPIDEKTLDDALFSKLKVSASEVGMYFEDYLDVSPSIALSGGLHVSAFDSRDKVYYSLQPRLSMRVMLAKNLQGHISANKMSQNLHLLTSSGIGLPTDLWVASTATVKPQRALQISTGLSWQMTQRIKLQSDVYYRSMQNLVAYREGASFLFREGSVQSGILDAANWEDKVTQGSGKAYGIETMFGYIGDWFNIDLSYTYAHSSRKFSELNFGNAFPFRFDRRNAVSITGVVHINDQCMVSLGWNYASGIPITLAESKFAHPSSSPIFPPVEVLEFTEYNAFRLPAYHRLDIGARYYWRKPKATHSIHLDIYNAYDRDNILYVTLVQDGDQFKTQQFTVLPFIPSLSYQLKI